MPIVSIDGLPARCPTGLCASACALCAAADAKIGQRRWRAVRWRAQAGACSRSTPCPASPAAAKATIPPAAPCSCGNGRRLRPCLLRRQPRGAWTGPRRRCAGSRATTVRARPGRRSAEPIGPRRCVANVIEARAAATAPQCVGATVRPWQAARPAACRRRACCIRPPPPAAAARPACCWRWPAPLRWPAPRWLRMPAWTRSTRRPTPAMSTRPCR